MSRNTSQLAAIKKVLTQTDRPMSIEEILEKGRGIVESLNQATVYRNVKRLIEGGFITKINHPTLGALYERTGKGHHHHFHCRGCNQVFILPGCALRETDIAPDGFITESHEIFLSGICPSCGDK